MVLGGTIRLGALWKWALIGAPGCMAVSEPYYDPERDREDDAAHAEQLERLHAALDSLNDFDKSIITYVVLSISPIVRLPRSLA